MKTKRLLKKWVRNTLFILISVISLTILIIINDKLESEFIEKCELQGYSYDYCIAHS